MPALAVAWALARRLEKAPKGSGASRRARARVSGRRAGIMAKVGKGPLKWGDGRGKGRLIQGEVKGSG